ncbi:MAG TPA: protein kinase [Polyangiaceae bacterium]|nr:protein kinase [Polyangiaceae bacterium]
MAVCNGCRSIAPEAARFCPQCGLPIIHAPRRLGPGSEIPLDFGTVTLEERIGEGGMGIVYRARLEYHPASRFAGTPSHPVAVKTLHPLLRGGERARRLFVREAEALRRLAHPNIVHFFAFADHEGELALVMEFVEGRALSDLIQDAWVRRASVTAPCIPFLVAWHYFAQLLGALAAVHAIGILHRDVKPANVLVRADGVVKLTDFGIARIPAEEAANTGGMAPGTGAYMSPEAVQGKKLDQRSDLYSAAIVLYEMLTATTPFDAPERSEMMIRTAQLEDSPPPITQRVPSAPPILDLLFAHALAKDVMHRYGSAIELGEAFRTGLGLPAAPGWQAQQRFAELARTISGLELPAVEPTQPDAEAQAEVAEQADALRADLVGAFREQ